ncbi:uncharacterized protein LOC111267780 [Varroa jacobsoni]|uniref:uncharacterized protein LOC111267780 n=1 Tax=Varroa jacobsoni TaxID=62625 RepID=UPI000BF51632|nr:uncharacterized protein LOC111267780 [Varroa jacobsoni]
MVTAGTVQKAAASYGLFDRENDRVPGSYRSRPQQVVLPTFARQQQRQQQQQQQLQLRKSVNNLKRMENDKNKCAKKKKFKNQCMVENDEADVVIYSSNKTGLNKQNESLTMVTSLLVVLCAVMLLLLYMITIKNEPLFMHNSLSAFIGSWRQHRPLGTYSGNRMVETEKNITTSPHRDKDAIIVQRSQQYFTWYNRNAIWGSSYEDTTVAADGGSSLELLGALPDAVQDEVEVLENRDCCPSVTELIHPLAGVSRSGLILEIYRGENKTQKFYQTSCRRDVKNRPCRFVRSKYELSSRCTQEYSYTYAIVRNLNSNGQWRMDHIRVRSGCACKVIKVTRQRSQEVRRRRK